MKGLLFDIAEATVHDGPGLRITCFLKGCPMRCRWCHSPEGQSPEPEVFRVPGMERIVGMTYSGEELADYLLERRDLIDGVTFSGGEPMLQSEFLLEVLAHLAGVHTVVETSGFCDGDVLLRVDAMVSRIHYGLKIVDDAAAEFWTGRGTRLILENLRKLDAEGSAEYHLRLPLIAGAVDAPENLRALEALSHTLRRCRRIDFLPANPLAPAKYAACGREFSSECRDCVTGHIPPWFRPAVPWSILD